MEWVEILAAAGTILGSIIAIVGANFTFMKFLLKDIHKDILTWEQRHEKMEEEQKIFRQELKDQREQFWREMRATNARMDGVYNLILKKFEK